MRIFVTGASGWIGSAAVADLLAHGHQVLGLARSDTSAEAIAAAGAEVRRGEVTDLDVLRDAATECDCNAAGSASSFICTRAKTSCRSA